MTRALCLLLASTVLACAAGESSVLEDDEGPGVGGAGGMIGEGGMGAGFNVGGGSGGNVNENAEVYGHSPDTLYKLDPITKQVTVVGDFQGCDDVIDLAIDKDGNVLATSFDGLFRVDKTNAQCTLIAMGTYPNSLSFVPEGTVDPTQEALVGYNVTDYVRINTVTGAMVTLNAGAIQGGYESSGDIVSVIGGGTYLTIKGAGCDDCLVEVDPATGAILAPPTAAGASQIFGLAYWGGSAYAFTNNGQLFELVFNGATVSTQPIAIPGAPSGLQFWGAGSSTNVPITPPE